MTPTIAAKLRAADLRAHLEGNPWLRYLVVFLGFVGLLFVFTWPLASHFGSTVPGAPGDVPSGIRVWWSLHAQGGTPFTTPRDHLINAFEGVPVNRAVYIANFLFQGFWWFGGLLFGWAAAYNLFDVLAFASTGLAAFALLERVGLRSSAALFGAYVFTFNPNHFEKFYSSAPLAATAILPLVVLGLFAKRAAPSARNAVVVGLLLLAAFYLNSYLGLFAVWAAGVFAVLDVLVPAAGRLRGGTLRSYYLTTVVLVIGLLPAAWSWAANASTVANVAATRAAPLRGGFATAQLFLLPGPRQPWLGGPMRSWLHGHLAWEGTMFIGYTTLLLALAGVSVAVARARRGALSRETRFYVLFAVVLVLSSIWAALPPTIGSGGAHVPVLQDVLYRFTTLFRVFARFGVLVDLGVVMLAVYALSSISPRRAAHAAALAAVVVAGFELYVPRPHIVTVKQDLVGVSIAEIGESLSGTPVLLSIAHPPGYVRWLADHPGGIVADYPSPSSPDPHWAWKNAFYQVAHHHPLWQVTASSDAPQDQSGARLAAGDLTNSQAPAILSALEVRFVVAHLDEYRARHEQIPKLGRRCALIAAARFPRDSVVVYKVRASVAGWLTQGDGFLSVYNPKLWPESAGFVWIGARGTITLFWPRDESLVLRGTGVSLGGDRSFEVDDAAGAPVGHAAIGTSPSAFGIPITVRRGLNRFSLVSDQAPHTRGYGDHRKVTLAFAGIRVETPSGGATTAPKTSSGCR